MITNDYQLHISFKKHSSSAFISPSYHYYLNIETFNTFKVMFDDGEFLQQMMNEHKMSPAMRLLLTAVNPKRMLELVDVKTIQAGMNTEQTILLSNHLNDFSVMKLGSLDNLNGNHLDAVSKYDPDLITRLSINISKIRIDTLERLYWNNKNWIVSQIHNISDQATLRSFLISHEEVVPKLTVEQVKNSVLTAKQYILLTKKFEKTSYSREVAEWLTDALSLDVVSGRTKYNTRVKNALGEI